LPLPEQLHEAVVFEQRALLAAQLYALPEPEQVSQSPVHKVTSEAQLYALPEPEQMSQLPVHKVTSEAQLYALPEPEQMSQLPVQ
jgi:hypothetical protein